MNLLFDEPRAQPVSYADLPQQVKDELDSEFVRTDPVQSLRVWTVPAQVHAIVNHDTGDHSVRWLVRVYVTDDCSRERILQIDSACDCVHGITFDEVSRDFAMLVAKTLFVALDTVIAEREGRADE